MKLILASQSPRRQELLKMMGVEFEAMSSDFDEYFDDSRTPEEVVKELGLGKARAVAEKHPDAIVIGSDLMVALDGKQLGKPETEAEAILMLKNFSNRTHEIITSVAVICKARGYEKVLTETSYVTFDELPESTILEYVATGNPYDKGGAYAIQNPLIKPHVSIKGRIDTVLGLPTNLVETLLKDFSIAASSLTEKELKSISLL
jgi:septum formation protein